MSNKRAILILLVLLVITTGIAVADIDNEQHKENQCNRNCSNTTIYQVEVNITQLNVTGSETNTLTVNGAVTSTLTWVPVTPDTNLNESEIIVSGGTTVTYQDIGTNNKGLIIFSITGGATSTYQVMTAGGEVCIAGTCNNEGDLKLNLIAINEIIIGGNCNRYYRDHTDIEADVKDHHNDKEDSWNDYTNGGGSSGGSSGGGNGENWNVEDPETESVNDNEDQRGEEDSDETEAEVENNHDDTGAPTHEQDNEDESNRWEQYIIPNTNHRQTHDDNQNSGDGEEKDSEGSNQGGNGNSGGGGGSGAGNGNEGSSGGSSGGGGGGRTHENNHPGHD